MALRDGVRVLDTLTVPHTVAELHEDTLAESEGGAVPDELPVWDEDELRLLDEEALGDADVDCDGDADVVAQPDDVADGHAERVTEGDAVPVEDAVAHGDTVVERVDDCVFVAERDTVSVMVLHVERLPVAVCAAVRVGDRD